MTDETGQLPAQEPEAPAMGEQPQASATPTQTPTTPAPGEHAPTPDKYAGKSVAEVARMHEEAERRLGALGNELGQARQRLTQYEQMLTPQFDAPEQPAQGYAPQYPGYPPPAQGQGGPVDEEKQFWEKPLDTMDRRVGGRLEAMEKRFSGQLAQANFLRGKDMATRERPDLYREGVGEAVSLALHQAWRQGQLNAGSLADPTTWHAAATMLHGVKTGFRPAAPQGGTATGFTEMPQGGRVSQAEPKQVMIAKTDEAIDLHRSDGKGFLDFLQKSGVIKDDDEAASLLSTGGK